MKITIMAGLLTMSMVATAADQTPQAILKAAKAAPTQEEAQLLVFAALAKHTANNIGQKATTLAAKKSHARNQTCPHWATQNHTHQTPPGSSPNSDSDNKSGN
jgi:hypothetical protein